jgi:hypothetical protein
MTTANPLLAALKTATLNFRLIVIVLLFLILAGCRSVAPGCPPDCKGIRLRQGNFSG